LRNRLKAVVDKTYGLKNNPKTINSSTNKLENYCRAK
jgi:hypothetical protein